jgi:hypothetical protein
VEYEAEAKADAGSLKYNENNEDVNDEIMDDEEDISHQGAGSARTAAKQSIPPLPTAPTRLFPPPPVIDLTVFNDDGVDDPDHMLSQQLAHVSIGPPTVQDWNRIMDNYQEEEYKSEEEVEIPKANDESASDNKKYTTNTSTGNSVNCSSTQ